MVRMKVRGGNLEEVELEKPEQWGEAEPEADSGDPAEAFDALRRRIEEQGVQIGAEMALIRQGVERAFEEFDSTAAPEDYKPQLAQIVQQLGILAHHLDGIKKLPVLRHGPDYYAKEMNLAGSSLMREAAQKIEGYSADLRTTTRTLSDLIDGARARDRQNLWLGIIAVAGFLAGAFLALALL